MNKLITFVAVLSLTSIGWASSNRALLMIGWIMPEASCRKSWPRRIAHSQEVLEHAKCIAVVPHMLKGGFVFGAENAEA